MQILYKEAYGKINYYKDLIEGENNMKAEQVRESDTKNNFK